MTNLLPLAAWVPRIAFDYVKNLHHPLDYGYDLRPLGPNGVDPIPLAGILLHSTEHEPGQTFDEVAQFGVDSPDVSWHYQVGEDGAIQRLLDPGIYRAWHAGDSVWQGRPRCNDWMAGIEVFHRAGSGPYPAMQLQALRWLCRQLRTDHPSIPRSGLAAHRWVALPPGRKADPTNWSDGALQAWIATL